MHIDKILERPHWIFDLDGTLTVPAHDFRGMAQRLGLPSDAPILESLNRLSPAEQRPKRMELSAWELEVALQAQIALGAASLLEYLHSRGSSLGILTRNTHDNARVTLRTIGLDHLFDERVVLGRDEAPAKPAPDGIFRLLEQWDAQPSDAVMVGDFRFDLLSGRNAGTATIYVDASGEFPHSEHADVCTQSLSALLPGGATTSQDQQYNH